jgi:hypothetical protein
MVIYILQLYILYKTSANASISISVIQQIQYIKQLK